MRAGDVVITSGLGGRFPPGFPVGTISALRPDDSRAFLVGDVDAAAQLDRGRDVLLLRDQFASPAPAPPAASAPATPVPAPAPATPAPGAAPEATP